MKSLLNYQEKLNIPHFQIIVTPTQNLQHISITLKMRPTDWFQDYLLQIHPTSNALQIVSEYLDGIPIKRPHLSYTFTSPNNTAEGMVQLSQQAPMIQCSQEEVDLVGSNHKCQFCFRREMNLSQMGRFIMYAPADQTREIGCVPIDHIENKSIVIQQAFWDNIFTYINTLFVQSGLANPGVCFPPPPPFPLPRSQYPISTSHVIRKNRK